LTLSQLLSGINEARGVSFVQAGGLWASAVFKPRPRQGVVAALHEAISLLTRQLLSSNAAFKDLMGALRQSYAQACEASKQEPDMEIMSPIDVAFKQLQNGTA
jgi:hypothetical protein|tara:strand:- start:24 stop:332 length:309 start_codon:yes stop_codon:yes gene_type:complete